MAMANVLEQACNHFLKNDAWPQTYEDLQPVPVLSVGQLTFAGDDGLEKGQTYRAKIDYAQMCDLVTHEERQRARLYLHLRVRSRKWDVDVGSGVCRDRTARVGGESALPGGNAPGTHLT